jgi:hypothetical protein
VKGGNKELTLSACLAIPCTCPPGPGGGPSGTGLHKAESLKKFRCISNLGLLSGFTS